jgi:hypothetical protein
VAISRNETATVVHFVIENNKGAHLRARQEVKIQQEDDMGRTGTNNGGGARWSEMPRGKCPLCGLTKPVGVTQYKRGMVCVNPSKCKKRQERKKALLEKFTACPLGKRSNNKGNEDDQV